MRVFVARLPSWLWLALLGAALPGLLARSEDSPPRHEKERLAGPILARVVRVIDGDTLVVRARIWLGQEVETSVRLLGADAPELKGDCDGERRMAEEARDFLRHHVDGKQVVLKNVLNDKYGGRVIAEVDDEAGLNLSQLLIRKGLARSYGGGHRGGWCS